MNKDNTYTPITPWEYRNKNMCREVQKDPYSCMLSNWEKQNAKMIPLRMALNGLAMGAFSLYYLSRHNEINRIRRLKFSIDMIINVTVRALLAGVVADVGTRKLFVNYDRLTEHKVATNEVRKLMTTMPNHRPILKPHERPNSYYWAM